MYVWPLKSPAPSYYASCMYVFLTVHYHAGGTTGADSWPTSASCMGNSRNTAVAVASTLSSDVGRVFPHPGSGASCPPLLDGDAAVSDLLAIKFFLFLGQHFSRLPTVPQRRVARTMFPPCMLPPPVPSGDYRAQLWCQPSAYLAWTSACSPWPCRAPACNAQDSSTSQHLTVLPNWWNVDSSELVK